MNPIALEMTEKAFQAEIMAALKACGYMVYHTHDSRRSAAGFPDLMCVRPGECFFAELKSERGRVSVEQQEWIDALREAGQVVHVWKPSDRPIIEKLLALKAPLGRERPPDRVGYLEARELMRRNQ